MTEGSELDRFLIEKYEEKVGILKNKEKSADINRRKREAWQEITTAVNALDGKGSRSVEQIKARYKNMYNRAKSKLSKMRRHASGTGGGSASTITLTATEQKIADLFGDSPTFKGILDARESSIGPREAFKGKSTFALF